MTDVSAESDASESGSPGYASAQVFDLAAPQLRYKAMLQTAPVICPRDGFVMAVSRAAVEEVLRSPAKFTSRDVVQLGNVRPLIPLSVDPPEHSKYRKILDPLFAPKRMDAMEDDISARVNRFIDEFAERGSCNFTEELAVPFPSSVFLGLMGLPWSELNTFLRLKDGIIRPGGGTLDLEVRGRIQTETAQEIYAYFNEILDERAQSPEDDILTLFLNTKVAGQKLSREEILDICFLLLIAGLDTVTDSLTCFYAFLAQNPTHRHRIAADPGIIPKAVEELLRWESPVPGAPRRATVDIDVMGCPVKAGDMVYVGYGSADVDPEEFPDPEMVDFDRASNKHVAFGAGVHRCLGSHLARRELRVVLREWHRRIPEYELRPGIELHYPTGLRTVENLELIW